MRARRARVDLTQREFELLEYLMRNERIVISRQRLLDEVWGYDPFSTTNTIEVFVSNLRRKLEAERRAAAAAHDPRGGLRPPRVAATAGRRRCRGFDPAAAGRQRLGAADVRDPGAFAVVVGLADGAPAISLGLQPRRQRNRQAAALGAESEGRTGPRHLPDLTAAAVHRHEPDSEIRILYLSGRVLEQYPARAPTFGAPQLGVTTVNGYRVITAIVPVVGPELDTIGHLVFQYGRQVGPTEATVHRVELFLVLGVLAGTVLALLAGMAIARRAMAPIALLTSTAAEIARTRDPSRGVPQSPADDEVGELARTLEGMLRDAGRCARGDGVDAGAPATVRGRRLARAAHTADERAGQPRAARGIAAGRPGRRGALGAALLPAHAPPGRRPAAAGAHGRGPGGAPTRCNLAEIVVDAAGELGPVSDAHEISLDIRAAFVEGSRDELHRLTINLLENALRHTPPGTEIRVSTATRPDGQVELVVADNGPGVPAELAPTLFERFVRGSGDRGGSFGLGLAIVQAVAISHGGSVALESVAGQPGARFVVLLPSASDLDHDGKDHRPPLEAVVD